MHDALHRDLNVVYHHVTCTRALEQAAMYSVHWTLVTIRNCLVICQAADVQRW